MSVKLIFVVIGQLSLISADILEDMGAGVVHSSMYSAGKPYDLGFFLFGICKRALYQPQDRHKQMYPTCWSQALVNDKDCLVKGNQCKISAKTNMRIETNMTSIQDWSRPGLTTSATSAISL